MSVTLTTSDLISIVGSILTLASIAWALYERVQAIEARKRTEQFRKLLLKQQIAQQFSEVPEQALRLFRSVRSHTWDDAAEAALTLTAELASLNGVQIELIGFVNKEQLAVALGVLGQVNFAMPRGGLSLEEDLDSTLVGQCNVVVVAVHALERSLRVNAALGGGEDYGSSIEQLNDQASPEGRGSGTPGQDYREDGH